MAKKPTSKPLNLKGTKGSDTLIGGILGDSINAMHGNDTIIGGGGGDTLTGGPGADTFKYLAFSDSRSSSGIDRITDFSAASGDKLDLSALKGTDGKVATLQTAYNASFSGLQAVFAYNALTNTTTLSYYLGSSAAVFQVNFTGNVSYSPTAFLGIENPPPPSGPTEGDDNLVGTSGDDGTYDTPVNLLGGNDTYDGLAGNDWVDGGSGNDTIQGGAGSDAVYGGLGNDTLYGGEGGDFLIGEGGDDVIYGGEGNDSLYGGGYSGGEAGTNYLYGEGGDDSFSGAALPYWDWGGINYIDGGSGNDTFYCSEGMTAIADADGVVHVAETFIVTNVETWVASSRNGGIVNLDLRTVQHGLTLVGSSFGDTLIGGSGNDTIYGGGAYSGLGDEDPLPDTLMGGAGNDAIYGGGGSTIVVFSGARADYSFSTTANGVVTVVDTRDGSPDGTDTLVAVTNVQFSDGMVALIDVLGVSNPAGDLIF